MWLGAECGWLQRGGRLGGCQVVSGAGTAPEDAAASVRPHHPSELLHRRGGSKMWTTPPTWESSGAT